MGQDWDIKWSSSCYKINEKIYESWLVHRYVFNAVKTPVTNKPLKINALIETMSVQHESRTDVFEFKKKTMKYA